MRHSWPEDTQFTRVVLEVEDNVCAVCGAALHICDHRAVYLHTADKYHGFTHRPSPGQKGMDEKAIMASQWPSEPW